MKKTLTIATALAIVACAAYAATVSFEVKCIHIGMVVSDLDKSVAFYKDVVGMTQSDRTEFDIPAEFGKKSGLTDSLPFHVEVLKLGSGEEATELKLMSFGDKAKKSESKYIHDNTGVQYLTFLVDDIAPSMERIESNKVKLLGETPVSLPNDRIFLLFQDPDGTFIEIIGPKK